VQRRKRREGVFRRKSGEWKEIRTEKEGESKGLEERTPPGGGIDNK
jgi:hypothetical protein